MKNQVLCVSGYVGITNERIKSTEKYPPQENITKKMEQDDNIDEGAQTTHQKQQGHLNNDQRGSHGNQPIQNIRLLQSNTRSDHER
jgi:hypothetical protein